MNFRVQQIPRVRQLHKIGEVGKWNYLSMTYSLSNNCTKNYYNRTLTVQVILEDVVTWIFLRHSVVCKVECLYLCLFGRYRQTRFPYGLPQMIRILNQHDPGSASIYGINNIVCWKIPIWRNIQFKLHNQQPKLSSVHVQQCYIRRQKAEIETENK